MKKLVLFLAVVFSVGFGGSVLFSSCGNDSSTSEQDSVSIDSISDTTVVDTTEVSNNLKSC